jgi:tetratricopeptide (TPR) repeat protein
MTRDWDLYTLVTPFLILAFLPALEVAAEAIRPWLLPIAVVCLVQTGAWVAVNASEDRSVRRYQESLERDPAHAGYGYEVLAEYYVRKGLKELAFDAYRSAHAAYGNPRYAFSASTLAAELGRYDEAIELAQRGLVADPSNVTARVNLATYLATVGNFPELIEVSRAGLTYEPDNPALNMFLGMSLFQTHQYAEARRQLEHCLSLNLSPQMRTNALRALDAINRMNNGR